MFMTIFVISGKYKNYSKNTCVIYGHKEDVGCDPHFFFLSFSVFYKKLCNLSFQMNKFSNGDFIFYLLYKLTLYMTASDFSCCLNGPAATRKPEIKFYVS